MVPRARRDGAAHLRSRPQAVPSDREPRQATLSIYLVRHAKAGDRHGFDGPDELRPLSKAGRRQAEAIAGTLADAGVTRLVSSPYVRCHQTLEPAAERLGLEIVTDAALTEGARLKDALRLVTRHLDDDVAFCSHGDVLGNLMNHYAAQGIAVHGDRVEKASIWVLRVEDADVRTAAYLPPPAA